MYDSPMDYYKKSEPRLRAYVIFPDDVFKGKEIEIYAGVYTGAAPVKPLLSDYSSCLLYTSGIRCKQR